MNECERNSRYHIPYYPITLAVSHSVTPGNFLTSRLKVVWVVWSCFAAKFVSLKIPSHILIDQALESFWIQLSSISHNMKSIQTKIRKNLSNTEEENAKSHQLVISLLVNDEVIAEVIISSSLKTNFINLESLL